MTIIPIATRLPLKEDEIQEHQIVEISIDGSERELFVVLQVQVSGILVADMDHDQMTLDRSMIADGDIKVWAHRPD